MSENLEKSHISVKEAAKILVKEGIIKDSPYNDQAIKRLIKEGHLEATKSPVPRIGFQISVASLNEYITVGKMSVKELREFVLKTLKQQKEPAGSQDAVPEGQIKIDDFIEETPLSEEVAGKKTIA